MRFQALDSWRGIAAVMVVFFHLPIYWSFYNAEIFRYAWLFVDFFFVLSGFVMAAAYQDRIADSVQLADFLIRRFGRVWPLHAAVLAALVLLQLAILFLTRYAHFPTPNNKPFEGPWEAWAIVANVALVHSLGLMPGPGTWNTPSWSISVEFYTYIIFGFVVLMMRRRIIMVSTGLSIFGLVLLCFLSKSYLNSTTQWGLARGLYGFFLGVVLFQFEARLPKFSPFFASIMELTAAALIFLFISRVGSSPLTLLAPFLFAVVIAIYAKEGGIISRGLTRNLFQWLGEHSYTIYMIHMSVFTVLNYATRLGEALFHRPLTMVVRGLDSSGMLPDRTIMTFGNQVVNDLVATISLGTVVLISDVAYRKLESPARSFFKRQSTKWTVGTEATRRRRSVHPDISPH